jgi:hypothetical protein
MRTGVRVLSAHLRTDVRLPWSTRSSPSSSISSSSGLPWPSQLAWWRNIWRIANPMSAASDGPSVKANGTAPPRVQPFTALALSDAAPRNHFRSPPRPRRRSRERGPGGEGLPQPSLLWPAAGSGSALRDRGASGLVHVPPSALRAGSRFAKAIARVVRCRWSQALP